MTGIGITARTIKKCYNCRDNRRNKGPMKEGEVEIEMIKVDIDVI